MIGPESSAPPVVIGPGPYAAQLVVLGPWAKKEISVTVALPAPSMIWIGIVCDDFEAQRRFYRDVLGLKETRHDSGSAWFDHQQLLKTELEWLASRGILLRDPETGLVDFPGEVDGRRIFLCWRLGEPSVAHYHEEHAGFSGRKPL